MASRAWNRCLMELFEEAGYDDQKPSYGAVFVPLFDHDALTISQIMEFSQVTKQTMTTYVNELKRKGYVETRTDPDDRRFTRIFLTPKGKALRKVADQAVAQVNREFIEPLGPKEVQTVFSVLAKWVQTSRMTGPEE